VGLSNILISANAYNEDINFYNLYLEENCSNNTNCSTGNTTTPAVEIGANVRNINFYGANMARVATGSTAYIVDIATWAGPTNDTFSGFESVTHKLIMTT